MLHSDVAAAILAGGQARRFDGRDKSRLVVEGRAIIIRQAEILHRVTSDVFVVAGDASRFADLDLGVHADVRPGLGPIGGLYTALTVARADRVLVVACDLPFLNEAVLDTLIERATGADGAWVRTPRGPEPLLACYARRTAPVVAARIDAGHLALHELADVLDMRDVTYDELARFGSPERLLANVNTPGDYARVQYGGS